MERTAINPSTWSTKLGFDKGELVDGHQRQLFVSGQDAVDDDGNPQQAGASPLIRGQHVLLVPSLTPTARRLRGPYSGPSRIAAARRVHQGFPSRRRRESLPPHRYLCLRGEGSREPGLRWRRGRARPRFRPGPHRTSRESPSTTRLLPPAPVDALRRSSEADVVVPLHIGSELANELVVSAFAPEFPVPPGKLNVLLRHRPPSIPCSRRFWGSLVQFASGEGEGRWRSPRDPPSAG